MSPDAADPSTQSRAKRRKFVEENELSRKRTRRSLSSPPTPAEKSRKPVGISQTLNNKQKNRKSLGSNQRNLNEPRGSSLVNAPLSEENLDTLQRQLGQTAQMEPPATPAESVPKRDLSRQPSNSNLTDKTSSRSQQSAGSLSNFIALTLLYVQGYISAPKTPQPESNLCWPLYSGAK